MGLPPQPPSDPWRDKVPLYSGYRQIGCATSGCWSPLLKRYIAIATVASPYSRPGRESRSKWRSSGNGIGRPRRSWRDRSSNRRERRPETRDNSFIEPAVTVGAMASMDAVIVGGGHNGLVAAAYLAKAGLKVLVLERRSIVGGACVTEEIHPGFRASTLAYTCGLL